MKWSFLVSTYYCNDMVIFGNGNSSSISHIGTSTISPRINLLDVFVVPKLTKNLMSINKLTNDNLVDVLYSNGVFRIPNRVTKEPLSQGKSKDDYMCYIKVNMVFW